MEEHHKLAKRTSEVRDLERPVEAVAASSSVTGYSVESEEGLHLRDYWRSVRKHLWLVIGIVAIVTTLAVIYTARKPDIYEAQARVQIDLENNSPAVGGNAKNAPVILNNAVNDPSYFNTQLQILSGPGLMRRVVKTLDLEHNQAFLRPQTQTRSTWQSLLRMVGLGNKSKDTAQNRAADEVPLTSTVAPATSRDDLQEAKRLSPYVNALTDGLKVEPVKETRLPVKETRLIDIRFTHANPQVAAKVANAIVDTFTLSNLERKSATTATTGDFLQKRIAELQADIRNGAERLNNYSRNNQIISLDPSTNTVVERLAGLNKELLTAENERKDAEAKLNAARAPAAATALAESEVKQIADVESKLADLRQKREQLLVENTAEWPEVKEVTKQIEVLERFVRDTRSRAVSTLTTNLETRYRQALAKEQALSADFNRQKAATLTQNEAAVTYRIIQQEIDTNKSLLDGLLQRARENEVVMAGTPNNVYVVDYAIAPDGPVGPQRMRSVIMTFILSLGFSVGFALFLEYLNDTVRSTEDVESMVGLPALAVIPTSGVLAVRRRLLPGAGNANSANVDYRSELLINENPRSSLAEAYRQLRTSVLLSTAGHAPKSLLVTSSVPAEGKTTTAINTAISLAQTGAKVLIIDADMRRPRIHSIFEIGNNEGLSTILASELSEAEILGTIKEHEATGLHLLSSGPIPPNPAELIGSEQMRRFVATIEKTFTHIVIDSPPIASFTDGVLISTMVDGVLLVVHGGKTSRTVVRHARQLLQEVGAKIFGVVLNNVELRSHDYYYQRYYNQSYYNSEVDADDLASTTQGN